MLYPCDAVSAERLVALRGVSPGPGLHAHVSRPKTPVIYANDETFRDRRAEGAARERAATSRRSIGAGVTVFEALKAYDELKADGHRRSASSTSTRCSRSTRAALIAAARATGGRSITVEDHYAAGGIGDAVAAGGGAEPASRVHRLAVREIPRSGKPDELLDRYGISARHIVEAVKQRRQGGRLAPSNRPRKHERTKKNPRGSSPCSRSAAIVEAGS